MLSSLFFIVFLLYSVFLHEMCRYVVEMYIKQSFCDAKNTASFLRPAYFNAIIWFCLIYIAVKILCLPRPHFVHCLEKLYARATDSGWVGGTVWWMRIVLFGQARRWRYIWSCVHQSGVQVTWLQYWTLFWLPKPSAASTRLFTTNTGNFKTIHWLPSSCAYKRLNEGKNLPSWHYLNTGSRQSVVKAKSR